MKKVMFKILGILFIFVGILFLLNSTSSITGFVIIGDISKTTSSIIGIVFLIVGCLLFAAKLEEKIEQLRVDPLVKSYRRYLERIEQRGVSYREAEKRYETAFSNYLRAKHEKKPEFYKAPTPQISEKTLYKYEEKINEARRLLDNREILMHHDKLVRLADRVGCEIEEGPNYTIIKTPTGKFVTKIPRHTSIPRGTSRSIMKSLAGVRF